MFDQKVKLSAPISLNMTLYAQNRVQMERKLWFSRAMSGIAQCLCTIITN